MVFTLERTSTVDITYLEQLLLNSQGISDFENNSTLNISSPTVILKPFNLYSHIEVPLDFIKSMVNPSIISIYKEYSKELNLNPEHIVDAAVTIVDSLGEEEIISVDLERSLFEQFDEQFDLVEIQVWDNNETKG